MHLERQVLAARSVDREQTRDIFVFKKDKHLSLKYFQNSPVYARKFQSKG